MSGSNFQPHLTRFKFLYPSPPAWATVNCLRVVQVVGGMLKLQIDYCNLFVHLFENEGELFGYLNLPKYKIQNMCCN